MNISIKIYYFFKWFFSVFFLLIFSPLKIFSQEQIVTEEEVQKEIFEKGDGRFFSYSAKINFHGFASAGDKLPFWMYNNTRGRINEETFLATSVSGKAVYNFSHAFLELGAGVILQDGLHDQFKIDELYVHLTTLRFYLTAGSKHQKEFYNGLSASNRSILYSLNAPPMPGLEFGTARPYFFTGEKGLGIEGSWNGYVMEEDRHVRFAKVHRFNFLMVYKTLYDFQIKAGIHHFAQWGGVSESEGRQPGGAMNYWRIITGQSGGNRAVATDQSGVLGNHLGSYELYLQKQFTNSYLEFFYNYPYEDDNRMGFANFPDGRYGLFLDFQNDERLIEKILYEFTATRGQSYKSEKGYSQNYFNNSIYRNGWAYHDRIIGSPFFTYDYNENRVVNNKFVMHHLGISGNFSNYFVNYPYKLLLSYGRNEGTFKDPYDKNQNVLYWNFQIQIHKKFLNVKLHVGGDYNQFEVPLHGVGVELNKKF